MKPSSLGRHARGITVGWGGSGRWRERLKGIEMGNESSKERDRTSENERFGEKRGKRGRESDMRGYSLRSRCM